MDSRDTETETYDLPWYLQRKGDLRGSGKGEIFLPSTLTPTDNFDLAPSSGEPQTTPDPDE